MSWQWQVTLTDCVYTICTQPTSQLTHTCTTDHITPATTFIWCVHCPHLYIIQMHSHSEMTICRWQWLCLSTNCWPHFVNCPLGMYNPVVAVVVWSVVVWSVVVWSVVVSGALCWGVTNSHAAFTDNGRQEQNDDTMVTGATVNINATMQLQSVQVQL